MSRRKSQSSRTPARRGQEKIEIPANPDQIDVEALPPQVVAAIVRQITVSPTPPADEIKKLAEVGASYADRAYSYAEKEQEARHQDRRAERRIDRAERVTLVGTGMALSFLLALILLGLGVYAIKNDQPALGYSTIGLVLLELGLQVIGRFLDRFKRTSE
jgi:uncharacterized membrane protein